MAMLPLADYLATLQDWKEHVEDWTWKRLVACEQVRTDNRTRYVQLGRDHNTLGSDKGTR